MSRAAGSGAPPHEVTHLSHSSKETYLRCQKAYQLSRIQRAPKIPAWWSIGGSAVHACTEHYDKMALSGSEDAFYLTHSWESHFQAEIRKAEEIEPDRSKWRQARMKSPPEDEAGWNIIGPQHVQEYIDWRQRAGDAWRIWATPDGDPAIELDVSGYLPGCDLEIKGYVDRVFEDAATGRLIDVDFKSGSKLGTEPQFGVYRALMMQKWGVAVDHAATFRTRTTSKKGAGLYPHPNTLERWTPKYVGGQFGQMARGITAGVFMPHIDDCDFFCDMKDTCYATGGELSGQYDPDDPGYVPPF